MTFTILPHFENADHVGMCDRGGEAGLAMESFQEQRARTQPVGKRCAGSFFLNPSPDHPAGRLIEEAGLKGFRVGAVRVSDVHANFIVNEGGARSSDVAAVIRHVRSEVEKHSGNRLELEVRCWPDEWAFKEGRAS